MLAKELSPLIHNPAIVYVALAVHGVMLMLVVAYVHTKFRSAGRSLRALKTEWDTAESTHAGFVGKAQEQISKLALPARPAQPAAVTLDTRKQVLAMGRRGLGTSEIARSCGLPEADVDVLLGMTRLQR